MTEPQAQPKTTAPRPAAAPPERPTVHLRPVAALAGNVAAAAGEAVFAVGGGVALAAVAAGAVGVPMVAAAVRGRPMAGGRGRPRRPAGVSAPTGSRIHRPARPAPTPVPRPAAGRRTPETTGTRTRTAGTAPTGRLARLLGVEPPAPRRARPPGRRTPAPGRTAVPAPAVVRPAVGGILRAVRGIDRAQDRHAGANLAAGGRAWRAIRARLRRPPATAPPPAPAVVPAPPKGPQVATTVSGKPGTASRTPSPAPKPNPAPPTAPTTAPTTAAVASAAASTPGGSMTGGPAPSAMQAMLAIIEDDMQRIAAGYDPEGIEEVLAEYERWPEVLEALSGIWKTMTTKAEDDYPLNPAAADVVDAIRAHQLAVAAAAREVPGLIRVLMRDQLDALADKRNAMLDHRANPNTAAM